jgi:hypothetical protein
MGLWREYAADAPRVQGPSRRLLIEGQRTNQVRNPRGEGAIAGTPGTAPTFWGTDPTTRTINGLVAADGLTLLDLSYTVAGAGNRQLTLESGVIAAGAGEAWTATVFAALMSGSGLSLRIDMEFRDAVNALIAGGTAASADLNTVDGQLRRLSVTHVAPATTARVTAQLRWSFTGATTARALYGAPQIEIGAFASTPILPLISTPAAATRGSDLLTGAFATLFPGGSGTVLGVAMFPASPPASQFFDFVQTDGVADNRNAIQALGGGNTIRLQRRAAAVDTFATLGTHTPGSPFGWGITWDNAGRVAAMMTGGTVQALTGASTGHANLRLGAGIAGLNPTFGELGAPLLALPYVVSDAVLAARVAALPLA